MNNSKIKSILAYEILDSRGVPTVKTVVELENGIKGIASVPSGASTGKFEAKELRDDDLKRYQGKGVLQACRNVNTKIAKILKGCDVFLQEEIDQKMINLDGTENKNNLGANAILSVSLAVARVAALSKQEPLYKYLSDTYNFSGNFKMPVPMFNIINGGKHADSGLDIQEFMIVPNKISSFQDRLRAGSEIYHCLKNKLASSLLTISVGDEGGFAPKLETNKQAIEIIKSAIAEAGYTNKINVSLDIAASVFYDQNSREYLLKAEGVSLNTERLISLYSEWIKDYDLLSIEDGLEEESWDEWAKMVEKITDQYKNVLLIGDDFLVTNINRLERAVEKKSANAILIKLNQIGTLTETVNCIKVAQKAGFKVIISHRSGETEDSFIADLAVGAHADFIKSGAPCRGERLSKYNRLLEIEKEIKEL